MLKHQLRIFRILGMLRAENATCFLTLWCIIILLWGGIILVCCQAISVFYVKTTNQLVEELLLLCTTSTIAVKLVLFQMKRKHLSNILNILEKLDHRIGDHISTIRISFNFCRRAAGIFFVTYFGSLTTLVFQLIFLSRYERGWKSTALVPNQFAQQPIVYYGILVIEAVGNFWNCISAFTLDTYDFILIGLLSGHIDVLSLNLSKIGTAKNSLKRSSRLLHLMKHLEHYDLLVEYV